MNLSMTMDQQRMLENERMRISRDIHDNLGARLTEVLLLIELAQRNKEKAEEVGAQMGKISDIAREVVRELDGIVWAINPRNDFLDSLPVYISRYAERFFGPTPIRCRFEMDEFPHFPLTADVRQGLISAAKEALNNVVKHSGASEVQIRLKVDGDTMLIEIEDNGKGFVSEHRSALGNGLHNMARRVRDLGGEFALLSKLGEGTKVRMRIFEIGVPNPAN